jgi:PAS domain S-box-containing protein
MPRTDSKPARRTREPRAAAAASFPPLVTLLARTSGPSELLPYLHQQAVERTGGECSILFRQNPRTGTLQATSGYGLESLRTDPWSPEHDELSLISAAFERGVPLLVADIAPRMPELAGRLETAAAIVVPLARGTDRLGLLVVGMRKAPLEIDAGVAEIGDAFVTALELFHLRQSDQLQRDVRALLDEFSTSLSATLSLAAGLDIFCHGANLLFGSDRTTVWIHDRRARQLKLQASSDPEPATRGARISTDDASTLAAVALRRTRAEIIQNSADDVTTVVTVPLRGTRRALGTIVFEGVRVETGGELDLLDRADELGRQLASAIENTQLIDDLIRSRRELENTFDSITHLVVVADRRGHITHLNEAFAARVGRSRETLIDRPLAEFVGPELGAWIAERQNAEHARDVTTREINDRRLKGPFTVTVTDLRNSDQERMGSVIVARDLTPQTQLEAEREELRRRLAQTEKIAALGQFVAGIAHELNNPLQGVLGHLELLRVTGAFPKQIRKEVQTIYREADRAAKIVRNLLVFAGSRRLARRAVSINAVLQKVLALRTANCRAQDIELVRHYDDKLPRVLSDPLLLHQVFLNMVMNAEHAVTAMGPGGRIEVATRLSPEHDRVIATVRDNGIGIAEDTLTRIFEPFYTTKEVGKGTGLGLAIAYGIVQEHGGQISAANHPEGGAVFTVELPTAPSPARTAHGRTVTGEAASDA